MGENKTTNPFSSNINPCFVPKNSSFPVNIYSFDVLDLIKGFPIVLKVERKRDQPQPRSSVAHILQMLVVLCVGSLGVAPPPTLI